MSVDPSSSLYTESSAESLAAASDATWSGALLSRYAPFTKAGYRIVRSRSDGSISEVQKWLIGWGWLYVDAERSGSLAWQKRKRFAVAFDQLLARHPDERMMWLRFSAPTRADLVHAFHRWSKWRSDHGKVTDGLRVVDQGTQGDHIWHYHVAAFGDAIDLVVEPEVFGHYGGFAFIKADWRSPDAARSYMVRRLRGYLTAKEGAWRRIRTGRAAPSQLAGQGGCEAVRDLADRAYMSDLRKRFSLPREPEVGRVVRGMSRWGVIRRPVPIHAEPVASRT